MPASTARERALDSPEGLMEGSMLGRLNPSLEHFLLLGFKIPHGVPSFLPVHSVVED